MFECSFLAECARRLERAATGFEELTGDLSAEQALWRPKPGSWSIAECMDHVSLTARLYFEQMEPAIECARARGSTGSAPFGHPTFLGRMILRVLEPGAGRKFRAPRVFRPVAKELDFRAVRDDFRGVVARLLELMKNADGLDLGRARMGNPAVPLLKMSLAEAFEIHSLHFPRHLDQARAVRRHDGFPTSRG